MFEVCNGANSAETEYVERSMVDWILNANYIDGLVLGFVLLLAGVVAWSAHQAQRRARRLSEEDPPTAEELAEVEALRLAGPFHLPGRTSAAARHFEETDHQVDRGSRGGPGCYEPPFVDSWRDQRSRG